MTTDLRRQIEALPTRRVQTSGVPGNPQPGGIMVRLKDVIRLVDAALPDAEQAGAQGDEPSESDELPAVVQQFFDERARATRDVLVYRAAPPEYPGLALVPVEALYRLALYGDVGGLRARLAADAPQPEEER